MRNMYDYAYEYEYQYHPERAGEMFAVVFASLWLAIMIGMLVFMLGSYLLHSFGLYTIAKRMGKKDAWMAFVPFARTYYHGNMAGPIRLKNTTKKIRDCGNCFFRSSTAERSASMYWYSYLASE